MNAQAAGQGPSLFPSLSPSEPALPAGPGSVSVCTWENLGKLKKKKSEGGDFCLAVLFVSFSPCRTLYIAD